MSIAATVAGRSPVGAFGRGGRQTPPAGRAPPRPPEGGSGGELEAADFEARSKASEGCAVGAGGSSSFGGGATSAGETISTAIGSAVTEPNGCTSANSRTIARTDRWPIADAAMPEPMNRCGSTVLDQRLEVIPNGQHSPATTPRGSIFDHRRQFSSSAGSPASIPLRGETEIGEPAFGAGHLGYQVHLVRRQREVENVDIFRQPFDPRRPRYRGNILLHEASAGRPAQRSCRGLARSAPASRRS